jgi:mannose-6-phosphate isomerase-like protein (cupin superfamily)
MMQTAASVKETVMQPNEYAYATHLDIKFAPLTLIDVPTLVGQVKDAWYNQTLCKVNDSVVRLGVMQGEYHWHKHDNDDEFFFVLEGKFLIDLVHRTRAPVRSTILMIETAAIVPTGDS